MGGTEVPASAGLDAKMCGFTLFLTGRARFIVLAIAAIASAVGFAALQEGVTQTAAGLNWRRCKHDESPRSGTELKNDKLMDALRLQAKASKVRFTASEWEAFGLAHTELGADDFIQVGNLYYQPESFHFYGFMTLMTQGTMCACGQLERLLTGDTKRVGGIRQYVSLSLLTLSGALFTNWSLAYLTYPTRVLFKSSKLLPTMAVGTLMQGRRYSTLEYVAAVGLVVGIVLFTGGDADSRPAFAPTGVALILIGVFADAATSNYEEKHFFRSLLPASQPEVIAYANLFGSAWELLHLIGSGLFFGDDELIAAIGFSGLRADLLPKLVLSAACGYVSVSFVLLFIKLYGATVTEMVKSMRKVITVVLSFILYPKPISYKYYIGGAFVLVSLAATHELQRRKGGDVHHGSAHATAKVTEITAASYKMEEAPLAENVSDKGEAEDEAANASASFGNRKEPSESKFLPTTTQHS